MVSLADRANLAVPHLRPCSAGHSYMVFDCKGNISKCQMNTSVTDISDSNPLISLQENRTGLQNLSVDEKEECKFCKWKYWCGGGCPLETFHFTGRYDRKSPNCNICKSLFPEIIRLEGLRLLAYGQPLDI
ncbi:MAG: SPASM domain-containing protein [Desulfococcaceae bacterium]